MANKKKKNKKDAEDVIRRNAHAEAALLRKAGPMRDRRKRRLNRKSWKAYEQKAN